MSLKKTFSKEEITKAVTILGAECFGALSLCNSLGGIQSAEWEILRNNKWADIVSEAKNAGINFENLKCAVTETPLLWSATIRYALGEITDIQRREIFHRDIKIGKGKWVNPNDSFGG